MRSLTGFWLNISITGCRDNRFRAQGKAAGSLVRDLRIIRAPLPEKAALPAVGSILNQMHSADKGKYVPVDRSGQTSYNS